MWSDFSKFTYFDQRTLALFKSKNKHIVGLKGMCPFVTFNAIYVCI